MQDLVGIRIIFYFSEDVEIFKRYLKFHFKYEYDSESTTLSDIEKDETFIENIKDGLQDKLFMPTRLNVVFKADDALSKKYSKFLKLLAQDPQLEEEGQTINIALIDHTFEVQFRSVLSEGWHEVEHDLRYKCKEDWKNMSGESRVLNGIYATIETCEQAMNLLWASMVKKYRDQKKWGAMIRNLVKLRMTNDQISPDILEQLALDSVLDRMSSWLNREHLIRALLESATPIELSIDNIILLANKLHRKRPNQTLLTYAQENNSLIAAVDKGYIRESVREDLRSESSSRVVECLHVRKERTGVSDCLIITVTDNFRKISSETFMEKYKKYLEEGVVILDFDKVKTITTAHAKRLLIPILLSTEEGMGKVHIEGINLQDDKNNESLQNINKVLQTAQRKLYNKQLKAQKATFELPQIIIENSPYRKQQILFLNDRVYE